MSEPTFRIEWTVQIVKETPGYVVLGNSGPKGYGETPSEAAASLRKILREQDDEVAALVDLAARLDFK